MFGIGSTELLVILVVALIVLGPKSLASVSRSLGKAMGEFRRVSTDFQRAVNVEAAEEDARERKRREQAAKERENSAQPRVNLEKKPDDVSIPPDSPLAQAIAAAKKQASQSAAEPDNSNAGNS